MPLENKLTSERSRPLFEYWDAAQLKVVAGARATINSRIWVVFSHIYRTGNEDRLFLHFLDNIGTRVDSFTNPGAAVYLYNLQER